MQPLDGGDVATGTHGVGAVRALPGHQRVCCPLHDGVRDGGVVGHHLLPVLVFAVAVAAGRLAGALGSGRGPAAPARPGALLSRLRAGAGASPARAVPSPPRVTVDDPAVDLTGAA